jgi:predicted choloylglycine hydrolase
MPELMPAYETLVELAGGGDLAARMLSTYNPPPYLSGCSQGAWTRDEPVLVRNYDYALDRLEGVLWSTEWTGRRVIGMSDSAWGLLDGMNDAGLAVSLTFGGRRVLGDGFGIPLIVRYVLELCERVDEARTVLARLPFRMAHNLTLVDATGDVATAYIAPDREPIFRRFPAATNHQGIVEWPEHARATRTVEREERIIGLLEDEAGTPASFVDAFLEPPLFSTAHAGGFGTLYMAAYHPLHGRVEYRWPGSVWEQSFDAFVEGTHEAMILDGSEAGSGEAGETGSEPS